MKPTDKKQITTYLGNPSLKACGVPMNFTGDQLSEYVKCAGDPIYFIENYVKIVSLDKGAILAKLFPYQKRIIEGIHKNRRVISKLFRQSGKSTVIACYISWYITFNDLKRVAILANKASISREIFSRVQFTYENLPLWLQQGVKEWNKTSLELENGSQCFCAASSPSAIRGKSINFLLCVAGETEIDIRNKVTGEVRRVRIDELENYNTINKIYPNSPINNDKFSISFE